jgi:hypothetical protein
MPKIGAFDYPDTSVEDAIEAAKKIARQFKTGGFDRTSLSAAMGFKSANSGTFNQKLADLRRFGVLEGRGEEIRATDLAQRLAVPKTTEEYAASVQELIFKIPLYKTLHDQHPSGTPSEEEFLATLLNITKAERVEVQKQSARIRNLFSEAHGKMGASGVVGPAPPPRPPIAPPGPPTGTGATPGLIELRAGPAYHSFAFTPEGIEQMARLCDVSFWAYLKGLAAAAATKKEDV